MVSEDDKVGDSDRERERARRIGAQCLWRSGLIRSRWSLRSFAFRTLPLLPSSLYPSLSQAGLEALPGIRRSKWSRQGEPLQLKVPICVHEHHHDCFHQSR